MQNTAVEADSNHFVDKILRGSGRTAIEEALSLDPTLIHYGLVTMMC